MELTKNIHLNKPDRDDRVLVKDINDNSDNIDKRIVELQTEVATKAPIDSPNFEGTPTAPNPDGYGRSQIATVDSVKDALNVYKAEVVNTKPDVNKAEEDTLYIVTSEDYAEYILCVYSDKANNTKKELIPVKQGE